MKELFKIRRGEKRIKNNIRLWVFARLWKIKKFLLQGYGPGYGHGSTKLEECRACVDREPRERPCFVEYHHRN